MALSLVCQDCKAQLRSVAEMQAHTEATSHVSFVESTEPVSITDQRDAILCASSRSCTRRRLAEQKSAFFASQVINIQCEECGKPCRSQTEKDLHTKRTGHSTFVDKVRCSGTAAHQL